uniref:Uncharacterized protein n=1 Tax=Cyprinodon variegatus TaxID=28743 RepID=A0A3Q2CKE9_CYPVA
MYYKINTSLKGFSLVRFHLPDLGSAPSAGFKLNNKLYQMLIARYADNEIIDFDNFTCCVVKLETMFKTFQGLDRDGTGTVELNFSEWLFLTMCG